MVSKSYINIPKINFKNMDYLFPKGTKINNLTKCNLFFGRNSSGKSSITRYIKNNYSNKFNVKIFNKDKGEKLTKKKYNLNALLLGKDNREIDTKVHKCESNITNKITKLHTKKDEFKDINKIYNDIKNNINNWYKTNAKILKQDGLAHINKKGFKNLSNKIYNSKIPYNLSKNTRIKYEHIIQEPNKNNLPTKTKLPDINILLIKQRVTNLSNKIKIYIKSSDYFKDKRKKFAIIGTKIHRNGDNCAFCGNKITLNRLRKLSNITLSNSYNKVYSEVNDLYDLIHKDQKCLSAYNINISPNNFYLKYIKESKEIIKCIVKTCKQYNKLFEYLLLLLNNERFSISPINLHLTYPSESFKDLQYKINLLSNKNNRYKEYKQNELKRYKDKILYDKITNMNSSFNLGHELSQYSTLSNKKKKEME